MAFKNPFKDLSKPEIYATLAGSAGLGAYLLYKHHQSTGSWNPWSSGTAGSTTSSTQVDPVTGLPYSQDDAVDPLTGLTYLAEAEQYGSVAAAEADVTQFGQSSATGSGIGVSPATTGAGGVTGTYTAQSYTSDAAWAQAAQAGLTDIGYNSTDVAAALGDYLTGTPVTAAQAQIIDVALSEYGSPPVGTFQVIRQPASGPSATATVPDVKGKSVADAVALIEAAGLVPGAHSTGTGTVNGQTPGAGAKVAPNSRVDLSVAAAAAEVTVPDVVGQKVGEAHNELVRDGLTVGNRPNSNYTVTATTPAAGAKVPRGRSVDITASPGHEINGGNPPHAGKA